MPEDAAATDADRAAIGALITDLYAAISGPAGPRDWATHRACFHEAGRQMRTGVDAQNRPWIKIMDPAQYQADAQPIFDRIPFYEREIGRRIDILGNMAHAWSLYEARNDPDSPEAERRGINSIQLFRDEGGRWRIVSMIWDNERAGVAVEPF
jgi:hypothetical protein